jgi:HK97 gp10 family phage protein
MNSGFEQLQKKLQRIKKVSPHSLLAGALTLQKFSMENAPIKTGFLRNSHESRQVENGAEMVVKAHYAYYQEFGTSRMKANPFVRPAIDEHSLDIVKAVGEQVEKEIKEKTNGN